MGIEEDLENMLKYANLSDSNQVIKMIFKMINEAERATLLRMQQQINEKLSNFAPMDTSMDPFKILGVSPLATHEEVDTAYKSRAKICHPDRGGRVEDMVRLNAAYEAIRRFKKWH